MKSTIIVSIILQVCLQFTLARYLQPTNQELTYQENRYVQSQNKGLNYRAQNLDKASPKVKIPSKEAYDSLDSPDEPPSPKVKIPSKEALDSLDSPDELPSPKNKPPPPSPPPSNGMDSEEENSDNMDDDMDDDLDSDSNDKGGFLQGNFKAALLGDGNQREGYVTKYTGSIPVFGAFMKNTGAERFLKTLGL